MKDNQNQELFTELTSEQASMIEGGAFVTVNTIRALTASSDGDPTDEAKIKVGKNEIWGSYSMRTGDILRVGRGRRFNSSTKIRVYDDDTWPNPDDLIGGTRIYPSERGNFTRTIAGKKSRYELNYTITA